MQHLKLGHYYRFAYTNTQTGRSSNAYQTYVATQKDIDAVRSNLKRIEASHPFHIFWIEESKDGDNWARASHNPYALFSED